MKYGSAGNTVSDALAGGADVVELGQECSHQGAIVEEIREWREFLALRADWDRLAAGDADGALLGHDWMAQAWKCGEELKGGEQARIVGWRDRRDGHWAALLALRHNRKTRRICFLEECRSQRLDMLAQPRAGAWERIGVYFRTQRDWDRLDLQFLRAESTREILRTWPGLGLRLKERGRVQQRRIWLNRPWGEVEAGFSPYLRTNFRRRERRLQALGKIEVTVHGDPRDLAQPLGACFALEKEGWKGAQGTSILDLAGLRRFYRQLAWRLGAKGQFQLYCLRLGGRIIAFEYCVADRQARRLSSLKIAYDEGLRQASPGTVLRRLMLPLAQADFDSYEFLGEDAKWKADWTAETLDLYHLRAYNRTLGGQAWWWRGRLWAGLHRRR